MLHGKNMKKIYSKAKNWDTYVLPWNKNISRMEKNIFMNTNYYHFIIQYEC